MLRNDLSKMRWAHARSALCAIGLLAARSVAAAPTLTTLATFNGTNGNAPYAGLIADAAGNLYGTTYNGGANNFGTVFKVPAGGGPVITLATFDSINGANPYDGLIADAAGNLYGTTEGDHAVNNFGTVFKVPAGGGPVTTLATFNDANGNGPEGGLIADAAGNLYGTTYLGGANNGGTAFEVPAGGGPVTTLATFNGINGRSPFSGLIADAAGNLYGTTQGGGTQAAGTVFELSGTGFVTPEPASLSLLGLGGLGLLARRRRAAQVVTLR